MTWKSLYLPAAAAIITAAGLGAGYLLGGRAVTGFVTGSSRAMPLLYRPSFEHVRSAMMLNSPDELRRLAGYYALLQNDTVDPGYLLTRFREETNPVAKRTIIWILGFARDTEAACKALESAYENSPAEIQRQIVHSLVRLDPVRLDEFKRAHQVDPSWLPDR